MAYKQKGFPMHSVAALKQTISEEKKDILTKSVEKYPKEGNEGNISTSGWTDQDWSDGIAQATKEGNTTLANQLKNRRIWIKQMKEREEKGTKDHRVISTVLGKPKTITREQFGMSDKRYNKLQRNREFNEYAEKQGWKPPQPKYGDDKGLKNYEKFYSNKANVNMLNKRQAEYFKKTGGWDKKERLIE